MNKKTKEELKEMLIVDEKKFRDQRYWELYYKIEEDLKELARMREIRNEMP